MGAQNACGNITLSKDIIINQHHQIQAHTVRTPEISTEPCSQSPTPVEYNIHRTQSPKKRKSQKSLREENNSTNSTENIFAEDNGATIPPLPWLQSHIRFQHLQKSKHTTSFKVLSDNVLQPRQSEVLKAVQNIPPPQIISSSQRKRTVRVERHVGHKKTSAEIEPRRSSRKKTSMKALVEDGATPQGMTQKDNELISSTVGKVVKLQKVQLENGISYTGEWMDRKRHGKGILIWPDGSSFDGEFRNNRANGFGKLTHTDGDVYEGQWVEDRAEGFGTYICANGSRYTGEWKNDKKHGKGIQQFFDGAEYDGYYINGVKHGHGTMKFANGNVYTGTFTDNQINGYGVFVWLNDKEYKGNWQHNKLHGKGVMTWKDGRRYQGEYKQDKREGYGVYEWADGRKYQGMWSAGRQHGNGMYTDDQGKNKMQNWNNGTLVSPVGADASWS